jgi:hypothetical protein
LPLPTASLPDTTCRQAVVDAASTHRLHDSTPVSVSGG